MDEDRRDEIILYGVPLSAGDKWTIADAVVLERYDLEGKDPAAVEWAANFFHRFPPMMFLFVNVRFLCSCGLHHNEWSREDWGKWNGKCGFDRKSQAE